MIDRTTNTTKWKAWIIAEAPDYSSHFEIAFNEKKNDKGLNRRFFYFLSRFNLELCISCLLFISYSKHLQFVDGTLTYLNKHNFQK